MVVERALSFCSTHQISIIVPMHNSSQHIATTVESILSQQNCRFQVIFIDAGSQDRTQEIVRSYELDGEHLRLEHMPQATLFEMINYAIQKADGEYIQILFPGDSYLYPDALAIAMAEITNGYFPDLFYSACFINDDWLEQNLLFCPLDTELLHLAIEPTALQACWMKKALFKKIGKFNEKLVRSNALDFFIRISQNHKVTVHSDMRVYTNIQSEPLSTPSLLRSFRENFQIIRTHFGLGFAFFWLFKQKEAKLFFLHSLKKLSRAFQSK